MHCDMTQFVSGVHHVCCVHHHVYAYVALIKLNVVERGVYSLLLLM